MIQTIYNGHPTLRLRLYAHFDAHGADIETADLVALFNCASTTAQRYRLDWRTAHEEAPLPVVTIEKCPGCGFAFEEGNGRQSDGRCLLCHLQARGLVVTYALLEADE